MDKNKITLQMPASLNADEQRALQSSAERQLVGVPLSSSGELSPTQARQIVEGALKALADGIQTSERVTEAKAMALAIDRHPAVYRLHDDVWFQGQRP